MKKHENNSNQLINKVVLNESEQKIIDGIRENEFKEQLTEGFQKGTFMTVDDFCQRLEIMKTALINKYKMIHGNGDSNR